MTKRDLLLLSFLFYFLAFLTNFIWSWYPYNWVFGTLGVLATLGSLVTNK